MRDTFYIYQTGGNYQLRDKERHEVIATSSNREDILDKLESIVIRYKTSRKFYIALARTELKVSKETYEKRVEEYRLLEGEGQSEVDATIKRSLKIAREDKKIGLIKKDIKIVPKREEEKAKPKRGVKTIKRKIGLITI